MNTAIKLLTVLIIAGSQLFAAEYRGNEIIRIHAGDTLQTDLFAGSRYVDIDGFVDGDLYAGCQKASVEGQVAEDVLAFCEELHIRGKVGDGVIGFAKLIIIDGEVGGDVLAFGGEVFITQRAVIKGNLLTGTGNLRVEGGRIEGFIKGGAGKTYLNGFVGKAVEFGTHHIQFGPDYQALDGTKLTLPYELKEGETENLPANLEIVVAPEQRFYQSTFFYWSMIALFIAGVLIISFFKNFSRDYLSFARKNIWKNLGLGFLILVAVPVAVIILTLLILTIPMGLMVLALYLILLYISFVFTALFIGDYVLELIGKSDASKLLVWPLLLGVILVETVPELPTIGWLFSPVIITFGMGSLVAYIWNLKSMNGIQTA